MFVATTEAAAEAEGSVCLMPDADAANFAEPVLRRADYLPDRGLSDHEELSRGGVPAAWIEWRWDPCWHSACDRVGRLDTAKLSAVIRLTVRAIRTATR